MVYIDPKDLDLQDAAGMQLAKVIRGLGEGTGGIDANVWSPGEYPQGWGVVDE